MSFRNNSSDVGRIEAEEFGPCVPSFLMCPPTDYRSALQTNPWETSAPTVDPAKAMREWQSLYDLLTQNFRVEVALVKPVHNLKYLTFAAGAGVIHKRTFVRSNFRGEKRDGDERYFESWFRKHSRAVKTIERPLAFDGTRDFFCAGRTFFAGVHHPADSESCDAVSAKLRVPYTGLALSDKRFFHLDQCLLPVDSKTAFVYAGAFETYSRLLLSESLEELVKIPEEEALRWACNSLVIDRQAVVPEGCPVTSKELEKRGFQVYALDLSEFQKSGAAARALVLKL